MNMKIGIALWFIGALWAGEMVNRPVANLYASPAENVELVSQAIYGTAVEIVEEKTRLGSRAHAGRLYRMDAARGSHAGQGEALEREDGDGGEPVCEPVRGTQHLQARARYDGALRDQVGGSFGAWQGRPPVDQGFAGG